LFTRKSNIAIELAQSGDDPALRSLLAEMSMPGDIRLAFQREPSFFRAAQVEGRNSEVIVGRTAAGEIIGMGTFSDKPGYINGQLTRIGYLSSLRLKPDYRSLFLLGRGFQLFKQRHAQRPVQLYLATITGDNHQAKTVLCSGRAGLPFCRAYGTLRTLALRPRPVFARSAPAPYTVRAATEQDLTLLLDFLNTQGKRRQFFPHYERADFSQGLLMGLKPNDIFLVFDGSEIVGSLGFWDQRAFKQNLVRQYSPRMRRLLWAYNFYAGLSGKPSLPQEQRMMNIRTGAVCCIKDDEPRILQALLHYGLAQPSLKGVHAVVLGFHEKDPLRMVVQALPHHAYTSRLYILHWDDGHTAYQRLDQRVPYLEWGGL
jgi:hypothetical protein